MKPTRRLVLHSAVIAGSLIAPALPAQVSGTRFEITQASDTALTFSVGRAKWVHRGMSGVAVDPRRHDALVAQFRILSVKNGVVSVVVTGATTEPDTQDIAVLEEPPKSFLRMIQFWGGIAAGFALGIIIAHR